MTTITTLAENDNGSDSRDTINTNFSNLNNGKAEDTDLSTHESDTTAHGATGANVGTTNTQTLTNKTLISPIIKSYDGWQPYTAVTPTYSSTTDGVDTISFSGVDLTGDYQKGDWVKISSGAGSNKIYQITEDPTYSTNTTMTVAGETSVSGTITAISFSHQAKPFGAKDWRSLFKFSVYRNSSLSIPDATFTKIPFDTEMYDTNGNYDNSTNYRYNIPVTGTYNFKSRAGITYSSGTSCRLIIEIWVNGVSTIRGVDVTTTTFNDFKIIVNEDIYLNRGDYVEIHIYQDTDGAKNLQTSFRQNGFSGKFIGI